MVVVRDLSAHQGSQIVSSIVRVMIDEGIRRFTGIANVGEAYRSLMPGITQDSVIGIKVNCINGSLSTHPTVVNALVEGLLTMNVGGSPFPANNIIIWDRTNWELQGAGYTINTGATGVRCFGTDTVGYHSMYLNVNGSNQHPSRILTDYCDYLINFGVMKNHSFAGVTFTMKNHYGSIQYPGSLHGGYCNPYIPSLNQQIRDVLDVQESLFVVDGIFGCYYGGPGGPPNMTYDGILLSQDRVAVDAIGRDILQDYGCTTLGISGYIDTAAGPPYYLGTANLNDIERRDIMNPSMEIENLSITHADPDVILSWLTPEYSGLFKVLRSTDPSFGTYEEIATLSENTFTDAGALSSSIEYFYRVVKTWG